MRKKNIILAVILLLCVMLLPDRVLADAPDGTAGEDQNSIIEYTLQGLDVTISSDELADFQDADAMHQYILQKADITYRTKDSSGTYSEWQSVPAAQIQCTFAGFEPVARTDGYRIDFTVTDLAPWGSMSCYFLVFVTDNTPAEKSATVHFAGDILQPVTLDITNGSAQLKLSDLEVPEKEGYTFAGWYLDEADTQPFLVEGQEGYDSQMISGDITLYPCWEKEKPVDPVVTPTPAVAPSAEVTPLPADTSGSSEINQPSAESETEQTESPVLGTVPILQEELTPKAVLVPTASGQTGASVSAGNGKKSDVPVQTSAFHTGAKKSTVQDKTDKMKNGVSAAAAAISIFTLAVVNAGIEAGIISDIRVLKWYRRMKQKNSGR